MNLKRTFTLFILVMVLSGQGHSQEFDGYCLYNAINDRTTYLIDSEGDIAYTWNCNTGGNYAVALKENGNLVRGGVYSANIIRGAAVGGIVQEYDPDGEVVWEFVYSTDTTVMHHDITLMPNGNVLITAWDLKSRQELEKRGYTNNSNFRYATHFVEVAQNGTSGEIVWEWHIWDHLIQDVDTTLDNYGVIADNPQLLDINVTTSGRSRDGDWFHVNGVDYDPRIDQITFSSRYLSEIFIIDHSTTTEEAASHTGGNSGMGGDLLYRWGNPGNYDTPGPRPISAACHDARFIDNNGGPNDGFIQVFNNSGDSGSSTVDAIETPRNGYVYDKTPGQPYDPTQPSWRHECLDNASGQSASDRLPNGNTFVCLSRQYLYEVDSSDNIVWQYAANTSKAFRYTCDHPGIIRLLNNPCGISTAVDETPAIDIRVGPNPTTGQVNISCEDYTVTVRRVDVFDLEGKKVASHDHTNMVDLSMLPEGTYLTHITFSNVPPVNRLITLVR